MLAEVSLTDRVFLTPPIPSLLADTVQKVRVNVPVNPVWAILLSFQPWQD